MVCARRREAFGPPSQRRRLRTRVADQLRDAHDPAPPFGADVQAVLYARPGNWYSYPIQVRDRLRSELWVQWPLLEDN